MYRRDEMISLVWYLRLIDKPIEIIVLDLRRPAICDEIIQCQMFQTPDYRGTSSSPHRWHSVS
jgi:hypothetical protein